LKFKIWATRFEIRNTTATKWILHGIAFGLRNRGLRVRGAQGAFFWQGRRAARTGRCGAVSLPIFAKQKFLYSSPSIWFNRKFGSSCCKACADYSGYEDFRKHGLIATVPDLLLRVFEGVAR
jgi:hypothetical protein